MNKIAKYGFCMFSIILVEPSNFGMKRTGNFHDLSSNLGSMGTLSNITPQEKFEDEGEDDANDIGNNLINDFMSIRSQNDNSNQGSDSSEISEEIIVPENPIDKNVKVENSEKIVRINVLSDDKCSVFYPMFYRASFLNFTLTKEEILNTLSNSKYKHNWIECIDDSNWSIESEDGLSIDVISVSKLVQGGRNMHVESKEKTIICLNNIKRLKKNGKNVKSQVVAMDLQTPQQPTTLDLRQARKRMKTAKPPLDYATLEYTKTNNPFVKFNVENKVIWIEKLPNCDRVNPSDTDIIALKLYNLIRLGVTRNFRITAEEIWAYSLPDDFFGSLEEGWVVYFNGVDVLRVVRRLD